MYYNVKYKLFFHTFNKEIEDTIKIDNGLTYFNGERNCSVYNEADAVLYVKAIHKLGNIEKLFKVPQEIYDSDYGTDYFAWSYKNGNKRKWNIFDIEKGSYNEPELIDVLNETAVKLNVSLSFKYIRSKHRKANESC